MADSLFWLKDVAKRRIFSQHNGHRSSGLSAVDNTTTITTSSTSSTGSNSSTIRYYHLLEHKQSKRQFLIISPHASTLSQLTSAALQFDSSLSSCVIADCQTDIDYYGDVYEDEGMMYDDDDDDHDDDHSETNVQKTISNNSNNSSRNSSTEENIEKDNSWSYSHNVSAQKSLVDLWAASGFCLNNDECEEQQQQQQHINDFAVSEWQPIRGREFQELWCFSKPILSVKYADYDYVGELRELDNPGVGHPIFRVTLNPTVDSAQVTVEYKILSHLLYSNAAIDIAPDRPVTDDHDRLVGYMTERLYDLPIDLQTCQRIPSYIARKMRDAVADIHRRGVCLNSLTTDSFRLDDAGRVKIWRFQYAGLIGGKISAPAVQYMKMVNLGAMDTKIGPFPHRITDIGSTQFDLWCLEGILCGRVVKENEEESDDDEEEEEDDDEEEDSVDDDEDTSVEGSRYASDPYEGDPYGDEN